MTGRITRAVQRRAAAARRRAVCGRRARAYVVKIVGRIVREVDEDALPAALKDSLLQRRAASGESECYLERAGIHAAIVRGRAVGRVRGGVRPRDRLLHALADAVHAVCVADPKWHAARRADAGVDRVAQPNGRRFAVNAALVVFAHKARRAVDKQLPRRHAHTSVTRRALGVLSKRVDGRAMRGRRRALRSPRGGASERLAVRKLPWVVCMQVVCIGGVHADSQCGSCRRWCAYAACVALASSRHARQ